MAYQVSKRHKDKETKKLNTDTQEEHYGITPGRHVARGWFLYYIPCKKPRAS